jgi:hypothetical protein
LIQAKASSDGGSAAGASGLDSTAKVAKASGADSSGAGSSGQAAEVVAQTEAVTAGASASSSSVPAATALVGGTAFVHLPAQMPSLTLKFFEEQRRARAASVHRFSQEFTAHHDLHEDTFTFREIGFWSPLRTTTGRVAMVTFSHKLIGAA